MKFPPDSQIPSSPRHRTRGRERETPYDYALTSRGTMGDYGIVAAAHLRRIDDRSRELEGQ